MALVISITDQWSDGQRLHAVGTLAFSGSYTTGGESVNWQNAADARPGAIGLMSSQNPSYADVNGIAGYKYEYDYVNKKILVRQQKDPAAAGGADIPLPQLAAAGYPAGVTGDTIQFYAVFKKF